MGYLLRRTEPNFQVQFTLVFTKQSFVSTKYYLCYFLWLVFLDENTGYSQSA